jgi:DNA-binding SARP family transcriptional activator
MRSKCDQLPRLVTLGRLALEGAERPHGPLTKVLALLAYLTVRSVPVRREELADIFWPSVDPRLRRSSLNQSVYTLKQILPEGAIAVGRTAISINASILQSDYRSFCDAVEAQSYEAALELYRGPFLEGLTYISEDFDDWRLAVLASCETNALGAARRLLMDAIAEHDHGAIRTAASSVLEIAPFDGPAHRARLESLAHQGDFESAVGTLMAIKAHFARHGVELPAELSIDPDSLAGEGTAVLSQTSRLQKDLPLVGRRIEIDRLWNAWIKSKDRRRSVAIRGEAGIGKSRLLNHFARRAVIDGGRTLLYSCSEVEQRLPYSAIAGLLRDGERSLPVESLEQYYRAALAPLAPSVIQASSDRRKTGKLAIAEAWASLMEKATEAGRWLIAIDDAHWIDETSREVLVYLEKRLQDSPILFIASGRSTSPVLFQDNAGDLEVVDLEPLHEPACDRLIDAYQSATGTSFDDDIRADLKKKIGGRPLLLLEALNHISSSKDRLKDINVDDSNTSSAIDRLIERRLESLSPSARVLVSAAACLNRSIHLFHLARITELDLRDAAVAADELVRGHVFVDAPHVGFTHDLLRDVVYRMLSRPQRIGWHYRIANHLAASEVTRFGEIAYHFDAAGDTSAAFHFADLAAQDANRMSAYGEADAAYAMMIRCASPIKAATVKVQWFMELVERGRFEEAEGLRIHVVEYYEQLGDEAGLLMCKLVQYAAMYRKQEHPGQSSRTHGAQMIALAEHCDPTGLAAVLWKLVDPIRSSGDSGLLREFVGVLTSRAVIRDDAPHVAAELFSVAALMTMVASGYREAVGLADSAVELAAATSDHALLNRALYARGSVALSAGNVAACVSDYEALLSATAGPGESELMARAVANYSIALLEQMKYEKALQYGIRALGECSLSRRGYALGNLALIHLQSGDTDGVRRYCDMMLGAMDSTGFKWIYPHVNSLIGLADLLDGKIDEACHRADNAEKAMRRASGIVDNSPIYELIAKAAVLRNQGSKAIAILGEGAGRILPYDHTAGSRLLLLRESLSRSPDAAVIASIFSHATQVGAVALAKGAGELLQGPN